MLYDLLNLRSFFQGYIIFVDLYAEIAPYALALALALSSIFLSRMVRGPGFLRLTSVVFFLLCFEAMIKFLDPSMAIRVGIGWIITFITYTSMAMGATFIPFWMKKENLPEFDKFNDRVSDWIGISAFILLSIFYSNSF